jgi:hypothetical protein
VTVRRERVRDVTVGARDFQVDITCLIEH